MIELQGHIDLGMHTHHCAALPAELPHNWFWNTTLGFLCSATDMNSRRAMESTWHIPQPPVGYAWRLTQNTYVVHTPARPCLLQHLLPVHAPAHQLVPLPVPPLAPLPAVPRRHAPRAQPHLLLLARCHPAHPALPHTACLSPCCSFHLCPC
jgi:hypothetical protein